MLEHTCREGTLAYTHTHLCTYMYTHTHVCTHARTHARMHTCMHARTHVRTHVHTHTMHTFPLSTRFLDYGEPTWKAQVKHVLDGLKTYVVIVTMVSFTWSS